MRLFASPALVQGRSLLAVPTFLDKLLGDGSTEATSMQTGRRGTCGFSTLSNLLYIANSKHQAHLSHTLVTGDCVDTRGTGGGYNWGTGRALGRSD